MQQYPRGRRLIHDIGNFFPAPKRSEMCRPAHGVSIQCEQQHKPYEQKWNQQEKTIHAVPSLSISASRSRQSSVLSRLHTAQKVTLISSSESGT
ncbi:MAG: hypothetical protein J1E59_09590, partial [Treponema sp.]|nr:hypothetical protein [Treponema sp.]